MKILIVEDIASDAELALREIKRAGMHATGVRVETAGEFARQLDEFEPDLILSDFTLPRFDGMSALRLAQKLRPQTPFIFISATIGEETAVVALRHGATDYVLKSNLARLGPAVTRAMREAAGRAAHAEAQKALRTSDERFRLVAMATSDALWDWDLANDEVWWNEGFRTQFGYRSGESGPGTEFWVGRINAEDRERVMAGIRAVMESGEQFWTDEYRCTRSDGSDAYVLSRGYLVRDADGKPLRFIGAMMDITGRKRMEEALRLRERAIDASINPIIMTTAVDGLPIVFVNRAFERITGYTREEVLGRNCSFLQNDDRDQPALEEIRTAITEQREGHALLRNYRKDGGVFWNDLHITPVRDSATGAITHFVGVQHDITETKHYQEELEHQATHDVLTGLANRSLLEDRLAQALVHAQRDGRTVLVAVVDLDHFKFINDSMGHGAGDRLLRVMGVRLLSCVRAGDTVARLGGDEFVLIQSVEPGEEVNHHIIDRVMTTMADPCLISGRELRVTCSIGVSLFPHDATDAEGLLRMADAALYRAKETGRNNYQFYASEMTARIGDRLALEATLGRALEREEFSLYFQPQVALPTGRIIGIEALIRWNHPEFGLIHPERFISLAEDSGLIVPIGAWVIRSACMWNKTLQQHGFGEMPIAVNLSARQFRQPGLANFVRGALDESGLDPSLLEMEITESIVMHNVEDVIATLYELKEMGVKLAVDDFGTGYSSLSYLKRFPVHRLKIDQSFVRDIGTDPDDAAIAQSIIALGHSLGLRVIAEGVETQAQLDWLTRYGGDEAQGFFFCKPLPQDELLDFLRQPAVPKSG